jgi:monovalent cation:H+ antiporter-2, CPA2 family
MDELSHGMPLVSTIAVAFGLALLLGFIAVRLRLPALVGYLLAGVLIGPATPGFVGDLKAAAELADIGVMLLMFGVGLHFSLKDLLAVGRVAVPGALAQVAVATAMGFGLSQLWGWPPAAGLVFGLSLSVASTVVLLKALEGQGVLESVNGRIAVGWLVVEDLVMVMVLVLLPPLASVLAPAGAAASGPLTPDTAALALTLGYTVAQVGLFMLLMLVVGRRVFPWVLWQVALTGSRELFTLCVISAAVGIAFASAAIFGVSFALGAFFAGMVLRESALSHRAAAESLPLRDAFAVLFFVSVGMLFDPTILLAEPLRVLTVVGIIVLGKSLVAFALVLAFRYPLNTALTVSAGLAQIGEFSFVLAGLGLSLGLLPVEAHGLILSGAIISIAVNPLVFAAIGPLQSWIRARSALARLLERSADPLAELPMSVSQSRLTGHVVLVGYGVVGQRIGAALSAQGVAFVVAEELREVVEALRQRGQPAVSGDAADPSVLIQAHIVRSRLLIIATPDTFKARRMIEIARTLRPDLPVVVRAASEEEAALLGRVENIEVWTGETALARSLGQRALNGDAQPTTPA